VEVGKCFIWALQWAPNVLIPSSSCDIIRVNHPSSEVLSALEHVLRNSFVLKSRLGGWRKERVFKLCLTLNPKRCGTIECTKPSPELSFSQTAPMFRPHGVVLKRCLKGWNEELFKPH